MRRMTIFRSELLPVLAALVITSVAQAQDTTSVVQPDTTTAPVVQGQVEVVPQDRKSVV